MDTLAAPEISELEVLFDSTTPADTMQLEVVYDSTTLASILQLRSADDLYSRGGSAPVELEDSSTEDEEQGHGKSEVEVEVVTEPTVTVPEVDEASLAATSTWPPGLPRPNNLFDKIKYDTAFAGVPTDVRTKEKVKPLPVVRLGKDWDRKRKERQQKERNAKGKKSYVIPKLGSTSASQGVGSTPTPAPPLSTPTLASEAAAEVTPSTRDIITRATTDILSKAGSNTARPDKEIPVLQSYSSQH